MESRCSISEAEMDLQALRAPNTTLVRRCRTLSYLSVLPSVLNLVSKANFGWLSCNDPAEPAQVKRLMQMPQPGSSCRAPGAGAGGYKSVSSRQSRGWDAVGFRSGDDVHIAPSGYGSRVRPCHSAEGCVA